MRASRKRGSMGESELKKGGHCVHAPPSPIFRECPPGGSPFFICDVALPELPQLLLIGQ